MNRPGPETRAGLYLERPPCRRLAPYVACFWAICGPLPGNSPRIRVLPDACMDLVADPEGGLARPGGPAPSRPSVFLTGATLEPMVVPLPVRPRLAAVRFRPGGAAAFLGLEAAGVAGSHLDLADVSFGLARLAGALLGDAPDAPAMLAVWERLLLERLPQAGAVDPLTAPALAGLARPGPAGRVERVARDLGVSPRQLERRLKTQAGLTPSQAGRTLRFLAAVRGLRARPRLALADLALRAGYADQAHFTREFRALCGLSPTAWLAETGDVACVQYAPSPLA